MAGGESTPCSHICKGIEEDNDNDEENDSSQVAQVRTMRIVALIYPYIGVWKELRGVGAAESLNGACKDGQAGGGQA